MKYLLTLTAICISFGLYSQDSDLVGEWELIKVETETGSVYPQRKDYSLTFTSDELSYNLEVNNCNGTYVLKDDQIIYDKVLCTLACCDGRNDPIAKLIRYQGSYVVYLDQLIITNVKNNRLYLERVVP